MYFFISRDFNKTEELYQKIPVQNKSKDFTNSIFNEEYAVVRNDSAFYIWNNLDKISDELHFNAINWYNFWGDSLFGYQKTPLEKRQIDLYKSKLDLVSAKHLKGFYEKLDFSYPMYGQRLVYEIQDTPANTDLNNGFVYQSCMRNVYTTDQGRTVLHPRPGIDRAGYLCRNIFENFQHSDLFDFRQYDKGYWYIKPVMRIPAGLADGLPVVTIEVVSFSDSVVKTITLKTENFKTNGISYGGAYVSSYSGLPPEALRIKGDDSTGHLNQGRIDDMWNWGNPGSPACCHVDFRVRWEGQVEVWFDKMVVDDQIANDLFDGHLFDNLIDQQAREFTNYPSVFSFFTDEVCISQVPCIKYVMKRMRDVIPEYDTARAKFSIAVSNYLHVRGLKNDNLSYKFLFDSLDAERVQMDAHQFPITVEGYGIPIPNVFPVHDNRIRPNWLVSIPDYNNALQNRAFGDRNTITPDHVEGSLIYQINKIRQDARQYSPQTQVIIEPQIQAEMFSPGPNNSYYTTGLREPTNEELRAEAMLALAHGADGLCWYVYHSYRNHNQAADVYNNQFGLLNPRDMEYSRRTVNMYNQDKWDSVASMNEKLLKWKPTLDNINWLEGYSVHSEGANHYYISDIESVFRDSVTLEFTNEDRIKYWEMGFFEGPGSNAKYLLMVNRRCVPEVSRGTGDLRQLKIRFNSTLPGSRYWKMTDITDNHAVIAQIDKLSNLNYDAGYFMPGEGRLFKLEPIP